MQFAPIDKLSTPNTYLHFYSYVNTFYFLILSATEKGLDVFFPSTEFEHQALMITVLNDYKELVSPQSSLWDFSQKITPFTGVKKSLHGSDAPLKDAMEIQQAFRSSTLTVIHEPKTPKKNFCT